MKATVVTIAWAALFIVYGCSSSSVRLDHHLVVTDQTASAAEIYLYRPAGGVGGLAAVPVFVDGMLLVALGNNTYTRVYLKPGHYSVQVGEDRPPMFPASFTGLAILPGETNYFSLVYATDAFQLMRVPASVAEAAQSDFKAVPGTSERRPSRQMPPAERAEQTVERAELAALDQTIDHTRYLDEAASAVEPLRAAQPDDVRTLLLAARLGALKDRTRFSVINPRAPQRTLDEIRDEPKDVHLLLDHVLKLEPSNAEAHYWKARLYGTTTTAIRDGRMQREPRDIGQAIRFAGRAMELDPNRDSYREALAQYLAADGQFDKAALVFRRESGATHPIALLLRDFESFPIPAGAMLLREDTWGFAEQQLERGRIPDYPKVRVRWYLAPMPAADVESWLRKRWPDLQLFETSRLDPPAGGRVIVFSQVLKLSAADFAPVQSAQELQRMADASINGLVIAVTEFQHVPESIRRTSPAGVRLPAELPDVFCYLVLVNTRASR